MAEESGGYGGSDIEKYEKNVRLKRKRGRICLILGIKRKH